MGDEQLKPIDTCPRSETPDACPGELVAVISDDGSAFEAEGCTTCLCTWWNNPPKDPPAGVKSMSYSEFEALRSARDGNGSGC